MSSFSDAPHPAPPSVHSLIASRSRHSPMDDNSPHQTSFSPSSQSTNESSWQSDRSDSPSLYSRAGMSPSSQPTPSFGGGGAQAYRIAAGSSMGSYDDDEDEDLGFTGRRRRTREQSNASTLTPSFQDNTPYSPHQAFLSLHNNNNNDHTFLSPTQQSPHSSIFDDNITLSGTESSPRSSLDNNRDLGPKLRFGEAAPWELDSPSSLTHQEGGSDGPSRRPSLPTSLEADHPTLSTSSSNMSFGRGGAALGVATGFRTRSRSATQTAAGVFKGLGGLVGRKKSKDADAEESWAASGLGIDSGDQGALRRKVSSETVMLGADLFGGNGVGDRDVHEGGGELSGKRSFSSLRIGRSSPTPSRAPSVYSTYSNQEAIQYSTSNSSSPNRPLPPPLPSLPTSNNPRTPLSSRPHSPSIVDSPSLGFINNTQHHGLISLGEAQARQKDKLDRMATPSKRGGGGGAEQLPSPLPSPAVASNARGRLRALASSSTIKQSNSEASVLSMDSVVLIEVDADQQQRTPVRPPRRGSIKLSSTEGTAFVPPLPTPPKSSLRNKKSVGGVGGLMKMFANKSPSSSSAPTSFIPPPLPSLPSSASTARPSVSSTFGLSLPSSSHSRAPSGALPPTPTDSIFKHTAEGFSSSVSNPFRTKPPPPNLSILPTSKSTNSNSSDEQQPSISPFPNLKLRPQSMAFTAGLPQSYLSSQPPPPMPSLAPASPYFEAGSLLQLHSKPPPSPSASSFASSSNQFSSSGGSTIESASLLSPTSAGGFAMSSFGSGSGSGSGSGREEGGSGNGGYSEEEKDLVIKRLEEMLIDERKIWRIKEAEYESQIRELNQALNPTVTKIIISSRSSTATSTNETNGIPVSPTASSSSEHASSSSCTSCGSHLSTGSNTPSASTVALHVPGDHLAATSILNRGKPKTGGARGVFGSGSLRE